MHYRKHVKMQSAHRPHETVQSNYHHRHNNDVKKNRRTLIHMKRDGCSFDVHRTRSMTPMQNTRTAAVVPVSAMYRS